MAQKSP